MTWEETYDRAVALSRDEMDPGMAAVYAELADSMRDRDGALRRQRVEAELRAREWVRAEFARSPSWSWLRG